MKVLMILGSRNPEGQTARAADALLEGVGQGLRSETSPNPVGAPVPNPVGAPVRRRSPSDVRRRSPDRGAGLETSPNPTGSVFLPELSIERCRQCEDSGWGICRTEGRCVITDDFAALVDKIREADAVAFATPVYFSDLSESMRAFLDRLRRISRHDNGKQGIKGKRAVGICVAGGGGGGAPECTVSLKKVLRTSGFDVVDMVPVRRQNLDMKVNVLQTVGAWLVSTDG